MDYSLKSLKDAFTNCYLNSNKGYKLYAMLLATSLDKDFILEYLSFFHELHHMTGKEVLLIGPQLVDPSTDVTKPIESFWSHSLNYLRSNDYPDKRLEIEKKFLKFLNMQTQESYVLADFLSIDKSAMPTMIFFERLDYPENFIIWPVSNLTGKGFIIEFRKLLEQVRMEANWDIDKEISLLEDQIRLINIHKFEGDSYKYPKEIREESISYYQALKKFNEDEPLYIFYSTLDNLISNFNEIKEINLKVSIVNIENTINKLRNGQIEEGSFTHLVNWCRRWKSRLPYSIISTIDRLHYPTKFVKDGAMLISKEKAIAKYNKSLDELNLVNQIFQIKRNDTILKIQNELAYKKEIRRQNQSSILNIIERIIKVNATSIPPGNIEREISKIYSLQQNPIPKKVFISYSHDNTLHKQRILELAQSLRIDGVDCWIDQFEESPEYGFTRWMYEQIVISDFVLIACTPRYKEKFEAIQIKGSSGGNFEGHLILQELNDWGMKNKKYIPLIINQEDENVSVPLILKPYLRYAIPREYSNLLGHIIGIKKILPNPIGKSNYN